MQRRQGDFLTQEYRVVCLCSMCQGREGSLTATEFEKHAGMGQAKKWKASLRMVVPERMPVGRWLDGVPVKKYKERTEKKEKFSKAIPEKNRKVVEEDQEIEEYKSIHLAWTVDRCAVCDGARFRFRSIDHLRRMSSFCASKLLRRPRNSRSSRRLVMSRLRTYRWSCL